LPLDAHDTDVHITGLGNHRLSRTHLFIPGKLPVNVIVPDNAWELGYTAIPVDADLFMYVLARRDEASLKSGTRKRFETTLFPAGSVSYTFYFQTYRGSWQDGLRKCFQQEKLYDLTEFDETLFHRPDLAWIKRAYVMHLMMAWDKSYWDQRTGKFNLTDFVRKGKSLYGGDDVICLWPTWPALGMDQRNQFDMYRDLPGGLPALRALADTLRSMGSRFFIAYNPWDEGTRQEGHLDGLKYLIRETGADGVVLDTQGSSSKTLQDAADEVKPGVIMYSEGMAIPKDMPGIVSGRVHNALYYPPMLNLNKLIQPDFAIFRVAEVFKEPIQREYATSFFNGYGTEINQFAPGHPDWETEQYKFLGRTSRILREHNENFNSKDFVPLVTVKHDSIWVNYFPIASKKIYTIYSIRPEGYQGPLIEVEPSPEYHFVDLWNHELLKPVYINNRYVVPVTIDGFSARFLGTNNEGQVGCVGGFKSALHVRYAKGILKYHSDIPGIIKIWTGNPDYQKTPWTSEVVSGEINPNQIFGAYEGKLVVQLFDSVKQLLDEQIIFIQPGTAVLTSRTETTVRVTKIPDQMVRVPTGKFRLKTTHGDEFIRYPEDTNEEIQIPSFAMDRYPVTNDDFLKFIQQSNYKPTDTLRYLRHWRNGKPRPGEERFPVVNISIEDARAFAHWSGKRLPTEIEWQYAAQTLKGNEWPWQQHGTVRYESQYVNETLSTTRITGIDPGRCNLGDGKLYAVGKYPAGKNPYGLLDLVGCVWQMTNDEYESGSYRYIILKGGSYFNPSASWWYVQGGPRSLTYRQYLLRVSQGFERNATVGFRCVKDLATER
jgi:iron(II)-dependent oxidoreductase